MIRRFKLKASRLFKDLKSETEREIYSAAQRFRALEAYSNSDIEELIQKRRRIKHRHALEVVAIEAGFGSWKELLDHHDTLWYPREDPRVSPWFDTYREAKEWKDSRGGYLLTCRGRYFVADADYIETLGLDPDDRLWEKIGFDSKKPGDRKCLQELIDKLKSASGSFT